MRSSEKTVNKVLYRKAASLLFFDTKTQNSGICAELLDSDISSFRLMVHMFYLQANDIR